MFLGKPSKKKKGICYLPSKPQVTAFAVREVFLRYQGSSLLYCQQWREEEPLYNNPSHPERLTLPMWLLASLLPFSPSSLGFILLIIRDDQEGSSMWPPAFLVLPEVWGLPVLRTRYKFLGGLSPAPHLPATALDLSFPDYRPLQTC